jgi:hypothetical protein
MFKPEPGEEQVPKGVVQAWNINEPMFVVAGVVNP